MPIKYMTFTVILVISALLIVAVLLFLLHRLSKRNAGSFVVHVDQQIHLLEDVENKRISAYSDFFLTQ